MKKEIIEKLFGYMTEDKKYIFANDFIGWGEKDTKLDGFEYFQTMEGNGLRAIATRETFTPQYSSIRRANDLELQFRSYMTGETEVDERLCLKDVTDKDVVIITSCERIRAFAPVYSSKLDLAIFLATIEEYCGENLHRLSALEDCISLGLFLYKNNPHKVKSLIDDL